MFVFAKACPYLPALITIVQNSWQWHATKLAQQPWVGLIVCLIHKGHLNLGTKSECVKKMTRNLFPNDQFRNNMFHLQMGTRNKTVLNVQLFNKLFHLQIGTRNKTVLKFGNKWPIWEQTVPFADGNSEQSGPKISIWEQYVPFTDGNSKIQMEIRNKNINLGTIYSIGRWEFGTKQS